MIRILSTGNHHLYKSPVLIKTLNFEAFVLYIQLLQVQIIIMIPQLKSFIALGPAEEDQQGHIYTLVYQNWSKERRLS